MKTQIEQLGKVCFTIDKNYHDINRDYDKLVIVESYDEGVAYASRKPVPAGTPLTNREYWIKFSSLKEHIQQNYNVIQQELNALYNKVGVGITFSGDYSTFDVGKSKTITLSFATVNAAEKASIVKLYQSDTLMDTYNNISEFTKEVTVSDEVTFRVVATIGNYTYSATWEVTRAYDWYIGGGANHEAVMIDANKHSGTDESISSIQSVNVNHSGDHIFICVQKDVFLPEVTMNGFTVPFDAPYTAIVDDVEYNVYKSSNAYTVNTYVLKIDAANWDEDEIFRNLISVVTGFDSETEDLQNRMETAEAVYLRHARQISNIIDRIDPLIERTGGSGEDAQPMRRTPSPWDDYRGMKHIQLLPKEEEGAVLTQEDFTEENTIYVIQYDFTLGENITIPANCVLEFDGGSITNVTNGNIIGKNTNIVAGRTKIFDTSVVIGGSWAISECYPEWMGAFSGSTIYDLGAIVTALNRFNCTVCFGPGVYKTNTPVKLIIAKGRGATKTILDGIFTANNSYTAYVGNIEYPYDGPHREQAWVKDMMIRVSPDADSTLTGCSALYIGNINDLYMESCRFANDYGTFTEANRLIALKTDDKNLEKQSPRAVTVYGSLNGGRFISCYFQGQTNFFIEDNANADTCNFTSCVFDGGARGGYANILLHGNCSGIGFMGETSFERMSYAIKGYTTPQNLSIYGARSEQATLLYDDNNKILGGFLYIKTAGDLSHPNWTYITLNNVELDAYQNGVFIECYEIKAVFSNILMRYDAPITNPDSIGYSAHLHANSIYSQIICENCKFPAGPYDISGLAVVESGAIQAQETPTFLHDCKMISSYNYAVNINATNTCIKKDMYSETYLVNAGISKFFKLYISDVYSANLDKYTVLEGKTFIDRYDISTGDYVDTLYCHFMFDNTFTVTYLTFDTTKGVEIRGRSDDHNILVYNTDYNLRMRGDIILHLKGELV